MPKNNSGALYVSNHAFGKFDIALIKLAINDIVIYNDTVRNKYLSFHWDEKSFMVPFDSFRVSVNISGQGFNLKKDTVLKPGGDRLQMFITFDFYPCYKRYNNPEIYSHVDTGTFNLQKVADSLYSNGILKNTGSYLNDTTPPPTNIHIIFKKRER